MLQHSECLSGFVYFWQQSGFKKTGRLECQIFHQSFLSRGSSVSASPPTCPLAASSCYGADASGVWMAVAKQKSVPDTWRTQCPHHGVGWHGFLSQHSLGGCKQVAPQWDSLCSREWLWGHITCRRLVTRDSSRHDRWMQWFREGWSAWCCQPPLRFLCSTRLPRLTLMPSGPAALPPLVACSLPALCIPPAFHPASAGPFSTCPCFS